MNTIIIIFGIAIVAWYVKKNVSFTRTPKPKKKIILRFRDGQCIHYSVPAMHYGTQAQIVSCIKHQYIYNGNPLALGHLGGLGGHQ